MSVQEELNKLLDEYASGFYDYTDEQADRIIAQINRIRIEINDILDTYSKIDDTISKTRINPLLRELNDIESSIASELTNIVDSELTKAAEQAEKDSKGALLAIFGLAIAFGTSIPSSRSTIRETVDFARNRKGKDGLILQDRIDSLAGFLRDTMQREIRYGVLRGETITQISRRVKRSFDSSAWRVKRIVTTELPIAFRKGVAVVGGKSRIIKAVKIIDEVGRRNHPKRHHYHECYRLAEQNMYGMGKGVYLPTDTFIFDPHPGCTAYFHYILRGETI